MGSSKLKWRKLEVTFSSENLLVLGSIFQICHSSFLIWRKLMLCAFLSPRHGDTSGCGWRRRPPDVEGSCE